MGFASLKQMAKSIGPQPGFSVAAALAAIKRIHAVLNPDGPGSLVTGHP